MKISLFNKKQDSANAYQKPSSENITRPYTLWNVLILTGAVLGISVFGIIFFSYNFLTKDREGVVNENQSAIPRINNTKLQKVESFFDQRGQKIININSKNIVDPSRN